MKTTVIHDFLRFYGEKRKLKIYKSSTAKFGNSLFFLIRENLERKLAIIHPVSKSVDDKIKRFQASETGEFLIDDKTRAGYKICPCNHYNAALMREIFTFTRPKLVGMAPAIGTGDRIGLATPGHIRAVKNFCIFPVFAQQSIREMDRTSRKPEEVLDDVTWAVFQEGYRKGFGADADHLKTLSDLDAAAKVGFTMYTIDPSDYVNNEADIYDLSTLRREFDKLPWKDMGCGKEAFLKAYLGKKFHLTASGEERTFKFSEESLQRAAVKYSAAILHTARMYRHLKKIFGRRKFDVELSIDETETPTSHLEHYFIISELKRLNVRIIGLALRFVGRFEKAIDYIGDLKEFEDSFKLHAFIARACGPYKLSIHSGSDKFAIYPILGKYAPDIIHLKTAGTSYLEALRVVARKDPALFREIIDYSLKVFDEARKSYHVSTDLSSVPESSKVPDEDLERIFLGENNARQLLHITYGSILTDKNNGEWLFRERIMKILIENEEEHYETVARHIMRHIELLWN